MADGQMRVEDQRFSKEDLFALLEGFDAEMFACPGTLTGPDDPRRVKKLDRWRRDVVRRYEKLGLVDAAANPRDDLALALEPLGQPHKTVSNASNPRLWLDERDERVACVYIRKDGTGTIVLRAAGLRGGYFVVPLATAADVREAILTIHCFQSAFAPAPPAEHQVISGDSEQGWANAVMNDRPSEIIACAARVGFDPQRLMNVGAWWRTEGQRALAQRRGIEIVSMLAHTDSALGGAIFDRMTGGRKGYVPVIAMYSVAEYDNIDFGGPSEDGIAYRQPDFDRDGSFKNKATMAFPAVGFSVSRIRAPRPNDPKRWWIPELQEACQFGCYDFYETTDQFVNRLLCIEDNPNT